MQLEQIPTTIFSGFLGSGKTTIIGHLIDVLQSQQQQVIYIKNEIGEENIDSELLSGKHIVTKELLNGCICCTLVGPFVNAINEIADTYSPDRVIIEASGAADPSAIALMISNHPRLYRDGVISVVDVINFEGYSDLSLTARRQATFTDLIVFNKVELVDLDRKRAVVGYVRELNEFAPIVEAPNGQISPSVVFGISTQGLAELLAEEHGISTGEHQDGKHPEDDHSHSSHLTADGIESFPLHFSGFVTKSDLETALAALPPQVFRVKGFFQTPDGTTYVAHKVGQRVDILAADTMLATHLSLAANRFVFIGFHILDLKNEVQSALDRVYSANAPQSP